MGNRRKRGESEGLSAMAKEGKEEGVAVSDGRERASGASEVSARPPDAARNKLGSFLEAAGGAARCNRGSDSQGVRAVRLTTRFT